MSVRVFFDTGNRHCLAKAVACARRPWQRAHCAWHEDWMSRNTQCSSRVDWVSPANFSMGTYLSTPMLGWCLRLEVGLKVQGVVVCLVINRADYVISSL